MDEDEPQPPPAGKRIKTHDSNGAAVCGVADGTGGWCYLNPSGLHGEAHAYWQDLPLPLWRRG